MEQQVGSLNYAFIGGRAIEAPQLHNICISIDEYELMGQWTQWEWLNITNEVLQSRGCQNKGETTRRAIHKQIILLETNIQRGKSDVFESSARCRRQQRQTENAALGVSQQRFENENSSQKVGQSVLQGYNRQVHGSNGLNPAQPRSASLGFDPNPSTEA